MLGNRATPVTEAARSVPFGFRISDFGLRIWRGLLACASLLILGAPPLRAATLTNCASTAALINAVEAGVNVKFSCASNYTFLLTTPLEITTPIVLEASCTNVTLTASNAGRLFVVRSGGSLTLVNLTLANGKETNSGGGGAILNQGTLLATNCTFSGNNAAGPAGADGKNGRNRVGDLDGHDAASGSPGWGGAVFNSGNFIARRCTFKSNQAIGGDGGKGGAGGIDFGWPGTGGNGGGGAPAYGGAIHSEGSLLLADCAFSANIAAGGYAGDGGASGGAGANSGDGGAGAAAYGAGVCNAGTMTLINCTFSANEAQAGNSAAAGVEEQVGLDAAAGGDAYGGACFNYSGATGAMVNCTFNANNAFGGAGGAGGSASWGNGDGGNGGSAWGGNVYNGGTLNLTNCTLSAGAAVGGTNGLAGTGTGTGHNGKLGAQNGGNLANSGGALKIKNCLLDAAFGGNASGALTDLGNNLSSDATPAFTAASSRNQLDPKLAALAGNGGNTQTMALLDGSPAVDAADSAASPALDQCGQERCGGGPDIGAYERQVSRISGRITSAGAGLSGILITCTNRTYITSANGYFEFSLDPGPTYAITPILDNYLAVPASINVALGRVNTNLAFTAVKLLTLTGRLSRGTNCLSGARITVVNTALSLTNVTTSDTNGYFTLANVPAGALTITPELAGYTFNPPSQSLSLDANATLPGFTADRQARLAVLRTNNSLTLQGTGAAAQSYAVQLATNWQNSTQLVWRNLTNVTADSNGLFSLPVVTTNGAFRFYRMVK